MKILIGNKNRAFCLHLPLSLMCSRVGAALLAGGMRRMQRLPDGSHVTVEQTGLITTAQMYGMLKAVRQSGQTLKRSGLPLVDIEDSNGDRVFITL